MALRAGQSGSLVYLAVRTTGATTVPACGTPYFAVERMDQSTINWIAFFSCLLGIAVGWRLLRWAQGQVTLLAHERETRWRGRLGLLGRQFHARALLAGGAAIFAISIVALF